MYDLAEEEFDRLTAKTYQGGGMWLCKCKCGNWKTVASKNLMYHKTKSCGCLNDETRKRPGVRRGRSKTREYGSWRGMIDRCYNQDNRVYRNYGGRGIGVCKRWLDPKSGFDAFLADMGERPAGTTLDRKDNNKGYSPSNCKWSTAKEQLRNTRRNRVIEYDGRKQCLAAWCEELGLNKGRVLARLRYGWSASDAFEKAARARRI